MVLSPISSGLERTGLGRRAHSLPLCVVEAPLAFTSAPGCTVTADLKDVEAAASCLSPERIPEVHLISQDPLHYSITSAPAVQKIGELETIIGIDPGQKQSIRPFMAWRHLSLTQWSVKKAAQNCIYNMIFVKIYTVCEAQKG